MSHHRRPAAQRGPRGAAPIPRHQGHDDQQGRTERHSHSGSSQGVRS